MCKGPLAAPAAAYCCDGCAHVARILAASGYAGDPTASEAFEQARRAGVVRFNPVRQAPTAPSARERRTVRLRLEGLWCASCAWLIEAVVGRAPGVLSAKVSFLADEAEFELDPMLTDREAVAARVRALGYGVIEEGAPRRDRGPLLRFGVAAFLSCNVMALSYSYYAGRLGAAFDVPERLIPALLALLSAPVVFICGAPILRRAWKALLAGSLVMDSLIALGSVSAYVFSVAAVLRGGRDVYFDGASALITFWLLGRALEHSAFRRVLEAAEAVRRLLPRKALRLTPEGEVWTAAARLRPGDRIAVGPGERVPVDGVAACAGRVSTAVVDGEARPRSVLPGDRVPGGAVCAEAALELTVCAAADESLLARIAEHVSRLSGRPEGSEDAADALARLFVPGVLLLSLVTAAACASRGLEASAVLERALSVLVVSCPCALGVAAPLARVIAAGALARRGVIVRGEGVLDRVAGACRFALDKTGTLTEGRFELEDLALEGASRVEALSVLAALERPSGHPVAQALRRLDGVVAARAEGVRVLPGRGVAGTVDGLAAWAGSVEWVVSEAGEAPAGVRRWCEESRRRGATAVLARWGEGRWAAAAFADALRAEAPAVAGRLKALGLEVAVLSGDAQEVAERAAAAAGAQEVRGALLPEDKVAWLQEVERRDGRRALFAGDGINDAPALAAAVGVAVAGGTDFARESADVLLLEPGLGALVELVETARRMERVIGQNLAWAATYNLVAIPAAVLGWLDPIVAAAAMVGSGLLVTVNSFRAAAPAPVHLPATARATGMSAGAS